MILYPLYRIGVFLTLAIPLKVSYAIATFAADMLYIISRKDRMAVMNNTRIILGKDSIDREVKMVTRGVFRNFAKYLVDFFRFSKIDEEYIKKFVKVDGLKNVDDALAKGKGAILLSAHIGNWELGGLVMSALRPPVSAVVLTHQDRNINDFFTRQRKIGKLKPIEIGMGMRGCYDALKKNECLALLGDRDFSKSGFHVEFFGKRTLIPRGPAVFSLRMGSAIVPTFMLREKDDTFRFVFDEPIYPEDPREEHHAVEALAKKYLSMIEKYIRLYPDQWYVFREIWNDNAKSMQPDTVI